MAKRIAPRTYTYRQHELTLDFEGWVICGPAVNDFAPSIREACRMIDQAPGAPQKLSPAQAGKLGAAAFYRLYSIQPTGTSDYAIVRKADGRVINFLSGRPY